MFYFQYADQWELLLTELKPYKSKKWTAIAKQN